MNSMKGPLSGELDPGFPSISIPNPVSGERAFSAQMIIALADGGFILGCQNDIYRQPACLVRISPDGSLDTAFGDKGYAFIGLDAEPAPETTGYMSGVYPLSGGKLLVRLETITSIEGRRVTTLALAQFTPDGEKDPAFGNNGLQLYPLAGPQVLRPHASYHVTEQKPEPRNARFPYMEHGDLKVTEDEKLLVLTTARDVVENIHRPYVLRLTSTGELDTTFNGDGLMEPVSHLWFIPYRLMLQADSKLLISGEHPGIPFIARFDEQGTLDTTFGVDGYFTDLDVGRYDYSSFFKLLPDGAGNIVGVGQRGGRTFLQGRGVVAVCKIDPNGRPVPEFNAGETVLIEPRESGDAVLYNFDAFIDDSNRIVLGGRQLSPAPRILGFMARLLADGQVDTSVSEDGIHYYDELFSLIAMIQSAHTSDHYYATGMPADSQPERLYRLIA